MIGKESKTNRGFELVEFTDAYGKQCSLQESSAAVCQNEDGTVDDPLGWLWLGIDDPEPQIMKSVAKRMGMTLPAGEVSGWMPYPIAPEVSINTRMHLDESQVRGLIARLEHWLETGSITQESESEASDG